MLTRVQMTPSSRQFYNACVLKQIKLSNGENSCFFFAVQTWREGIIMHEWCLLYITLLTLYLAQLLTMPSNDLPLLTIIIERLLLYP